MISADDIFLFMPFFDTPFRLMPPCRLFLHFLAIDSFMFSLIAEPPLPFQFSSYSLPASTALLMPSLR
jgi:hypothetical protein